MKTQVLDYDGLTVCVEEIKSLVNDSMMTPSQVIALMEVGISTDDAYIPLETGE